MTKENKNDTEMISVITKHGKDMENIGQRSAALKIASKVMEYISKPGVQAEPLWHLKQWIDHTYLKEER